MTALEERLAAELREESETITPGSLVDLRLPRRASRPHWVPRRGGTRNWQLWGTPLAAATAVIAVIVATVTVSHSIPRPGPRPAAAADYSRAPAYYAYETNGPMGNPGVTVRSTATGTVLDTVRPPAPYNNISLLTASADGTVFVFAATRLVKLAKHGNWATDSTLPDEFEAIRVTNAGGIRVSPLSLPETVTPAQVPGIALSPDGSRLALTYTSGPHVAVVQVITLSTGFTLQWASAAASWQPIAQSQGAWTADGRTFAVGQPELQPLTPIGHQSGPGPDAMVVRLFTITAQGTSLVFAKTLTLRSPAGEPLGNPFFLTPDGNTLIAPTMPYGGHQPGDRWHGAFALYSTRTGALRATTAPWAWTWPGGRSVAVVPEPTVIWSSLSGSQLIALEPADNQNRLGVLTMYRYTPAGPRQPASGYGVSPDGAGLPPYRSAGYRALENALLTNPQLAW